MDTFSINGREPTWPEGGAIALWFARILPQEPEMALGEGLPLLMLEFWIPDSAYVRYMRSNRHYASFGDVLLKKDGSGWKGSIRIGDLTATVRCTPTGPESGGPGSRGMQVLIAPKPFEANSLARIAFAGHRERRCADDWSWTIVGAHPLSRAVQVKPPLYQYGYRLHGRLYERAHNR